MLDSHILIVINRMLEGPDAAGFALDQIARYKDVRRSGCSRNDERVTMERSRQFAAASGAQFVDVGELGHIGSAAKRGVWPRGLFRLSQFIGSITAGN